MRKTSSIRIIYKAINKYIPTILLILGVFFVVFTMVVAIIGYQRDSISVTDNNHPSLAEDKSDENLDSNVEESPECTNEHNDDKNDTKETACSHEQTETSDSDPENNAINNNNSNSTSDNGSQQAPASTQQQPTARTPDTSTSGISKDDMSGCWKLDNTRYAVMCYKGNMQGVNYKWSSAYMEILNGKIVTTENDGWWPSGQTYGWSKYLGTIFGDAKLMSSKYSAKYQKPKLYITLNGITYSFTKTSGNTVSHPPLSSSFLDANGTPYSQSSPAYNETTISIEPGFTKTIYLHKEKGWFFDLRIWENINNGSSISVEFLGKRGDDYAFRITVPRSSEHSSGYLLYFPGARLRVECY